MIFIGRDSLLLSLDGGPGNSLRNSFKKTIFCLKFDSPNPKAPSTRPCVCWGQHQVLFSDALHLSAELSVMWVLGTNSGLTQWAISLGYFTFWESILDQELTNQGWLRSKARDPPVSCPPQVLGLQEHAMASSFPHVCWSHEHWLPALLIEPSPQSCGIIFRTVTLRNKCLCGPGLAQTGSWQI